MTSASATYVSGVETKIFFEKKDGELIPNLVICAKQECRPTVWKSKSREALSTELAIPVDLADLMLEIQSNMFLVIPLLTLLFLCIGLASSPPDLKTQGLRYFCLYRFSFQVSALASLGAAHNFWVIAHMLRQPISKASKGLNFEYGLPMMGIHWFMAGYMILYVLVEAFMCKEKESLLRDETDVIPGYTKDTRPKYPESPVPDQSSRLESRAGVADAKATRYEDVKYRPDPSPPPDHMN